MIFWTFIFLTLGVLESNGAKILAFLPMGSHSHQNTYRPIFRALAKRGHDITYVTTLPDTKAPYKQITIEDNFFDDIEKEVDFYAMRKNTWLDDLLLMVSLTDPPIRRVLSDPQVQELIHSTNVTFDIVFTEAILYQEAYIVFGHKFNALTIELAALCPTFWHYHLLGNPYSFSHTVSYEAHSSDWMTFLERLRNTVVGATHLLAKTYFFLPKQEIFVEEFFKYPGWQDRPPLVDLLTNVALLLHNTHATTHYPHAYNPNWIGISGIQLQEPEKLPQDLQTYLDNAKEGVVYFSLGSFLKASSLPQATKKTLLEAFGKLPYKVLWKWEEDSLPNKPLNVKTSKWFPQKDILAHPNVKLFITHCGLASMTEAIYQGLPLVLIPVAFDQTKNSKKAEASGMGVVVDFDNITVKSITWAVSTVITDPSYLAAAHRESKILRDNPMNALDNAVWWIEYVLRHKGAPHMRTAAAHLPWYKYYLIDVVAVLLLFVILVITSLYVALRFTYKLLCGKQSKKIKKK